MEVMQTLHMNKGTGQTSYAKNSTVQMEIISHGQSILEEAVIKCLLKTVPKSMGIADLGCGSGPNSSMVIFQIINTVCSNIRSSALPELRVLLNDLPQNDFTHIFASLPEFYDKLQKEKGIGRESCFVSVVAGTFHGRLFPKNSLHFVHSSSSLHWLSQVPACLRIKTGRQVNKGNVYISKTSSRSVANAYLAQFQDDLSAFLRCRAEEVVHGGCMVLSFMGKLPFEANSPQWELLGQALMSMAFEGLVDEEKIDSFNAPYYTPSIEEVRSIVREEGSFSITRIESFEVECINDCKHVLRTMSKGEQVARNMRAVIESMLESHFGSNVMDELFSRYAKLFDNYLSVDGTKLVNLVFSISKK